MGENKTYLDQFKKAVEDDLDNKLPGAKIVRAPILSRKEAEPQKGDIIKRSMIRHDYKKLIKGTMSKIEAMPVAVS